MYITYIFIYVYIYIYIYIYIYQKFISVNLSLKVVIVKNYYALKLIQNFIFDDHVKKLSENCKH